MNQYYIYCEQNGMVHTVHRQYKLICRLTIAAAVVTALLVREKKVNKDLKKQLHDIRQKQETETA